MYLCSSGEHCWIKILIEPPTFPKPRTCRQILDFCRSSGKPIIFVFDNLWSMGTCIKLVTTKSTNFCRTFEKVGKLRSYENFQASFQWIFLIHKFLDSSGQSALNEFKFLLRWRRKRVRTIFSKMKVSMDVTIFNRCSSREGRGRKYQKTLLKTFCQKWQKFFLEGMIRIFSDRFTLTTCNGLLKPRVRGFESDNCFILPVS